MNLDEQLHNCLEFIEGNTNSIDKSDVEALWKAAGDAERRADHATSDLTQVIEISKLLARCRQLESALKKIAGKEVYDVVPSGDSTFEEMGRYVMPKRENFFRSIARDALESEAQNDNG
jgi:hypothetical protein